MEYIYNLIMGQQQSVQKVNFEDVQFIINSSRNNYILINTLSKTYPRLFNNPIQ